MSTTSKTKISKQKQKVSKKAQRVPGAPANRSAGTVIAYASRQGHSPQQLKASTGGIRIRHREFFATVVVEPQKSEGVWMWTVQPGWSSMFPWLSGIASLFQRYKLHSLEFCYNPRVPATTNGTVVLSLNPDPDDPGVTEDESGRRRLLSEACSSEANAYVPQELRVPATVLKSALERFIRAESDTFTVEPRTADLGVLSVGYWGAASLMSNTVWGDLTVCYDIELLNPHLPGVVGGQGASLTSVSLSSADDGPADIYKPWLCSGSGCSVRQVGPEREGANWQWDTILGALYLGPKEGPEPAPNFSGTLHAITEVFKDEGDPSADFEGRSLVARIYNAASILVATYEGLTQVINSEIVGSTGEGHGFLHFFADVLVPAGTYLVLEFLGSPWVNGYKALMTLGASPLCLFEGSYDGGWFGQSTLVRFGSARNSRRDHDWDIGQRAISQSRVSRRTSVPFLKFPVLGTRPSTSSDSRGHDSPPGESRIREKDAAKGKTPK